MKLLIGIDVGGTFTDAVALDELSGKLWRTKVRSTPADQSEGFIDGARAIMQQAGATPSQVARVVHGTTVGTNAILEQRGARIGILTTAGFEDTLYIGRMKRTEMYDLFMTSVTPTFLAPRKRIAGITGRIGPDGRQVAPLDTAQVEEAVDRLVRKHSVEAIAVSYLFSFANPVHEEETARLIHRMFPDLPLSLSSRIDPRFREYERLCLTAFDAYIRPVMQRYLCRLRDRLKGEGIGAELQIIHSRGGITGVEVLLEKPVGTILSGLAAGVIGGRQAGHSAGSDNVLTFDMGGTSTDLAMVKDGRVFISSEGRIGRYPLRQPMVDVETVGAGGGSIARVDITGSLRVGPQSAGAMPGPACYGTGGTEPTVTDASLVLGYLGEEGLAGGSLKLDRHLASRAIEERAAGPLGLPLAKAAAGIHKIVNATMADALRLITIRRGYDPRGFALVALGGAGPVHAGRVAMELRIPRVIIPPAPGVLAAYGLLMAEIDHQEWATFRARSDDLQPERMAEAFTHLNEVCARRMATDGVPAGTARVRWTGEMRYVGQSYELEVPVRVGPVTAETITEAVARFHDVHKQTYGQHDPAGVVEWVSIRSSHTFPLPQPERIQPQASGGGAAAGERPVYFDEFGDYVSTPVLPRESLAPGFRVKGPAIVTQTDTTTVVYPGQELWVDDHANLILETGG